MELTKLEYTAIQIYTAMISTLNEKPEGDGCECEEMITKAIHGAHMMLNQLATQENHYES